MKKMAFIILFFTASSNFGQQSDPVHFNYTAKKIGDKTFDIHMTATLDAGWHIYAEVQPKTAISVPTKIMINKNPLFLLNGKPREIGKIEKQKIKEVNIEQDMYEHAVDFVQSVTLSAIATTNLSGTITYQACTREMCLAPKTISFSISLP